MTALVWRGKCLSMRPEKRVISGCCVLAGGETGRFRHRCEHRRPILAETLQREVVRPVEELQTEIQNGNSG
jgi:hypothetical protein